MKSLLAAVAALAIAAGPALAATPAELARWRAEAARVGIVRDDWGIAHVHGRTDADAVFGAVYAQAEDDFGRIETNDLDALGRPPPRGGRSPPASIPPTPSSGTSARRRPPPRHGPPNGPGHRPRPPRGGAPADR